MPRLWHLQYSQRNGFVISNENHLQYSQRNGFVISHFSSFHFPSISFIVTQSSLSLLLGSPLKKFLHFISSVVVPVALHVNAFSNRLSLYPIHALSTLLQNKKGGNLLISIIYSQVKIHYVTILFGTMNWMNDHYCRYCLQFFKNYLQLKICPPKIIQLINILTSSSHPLRM